MSLLTITVQIPDLRGLSAAVRERVEYVVAVTAQAAAADVKASMPNEGGGRTYRIGDVTRPMRQNERPGMVVWARQGQTVMRTAGGYRAKENAVGTGVNVVIGARLHRASAPGEPPAIDTGHLVNSIHCEQLGPMRWTVTTGDCEYAKALEYGTVNMAARPYMRPALERWRGPFVDAVREAIRP